MLKHPFLLLILFPFIGYSQPSNFWKNSPSEFDLYLANINKHHSISYNAILRTWSSVRVDTNIVKEVIVLEKVPSDTMLGGKVFLSNKYFEKYYDGIDVYEHPKDSNYIQKTLLSEQGIYTILGNSSALGILFDFIDSSSWVFNKSYASTNTLNGRWVTDTFFVKKPNSDSQTEVTYCFKRNSKFPYKISWSAKSKGVTSVRELYISNVKFDEGITNYEKQMMGKGYKIEIKHPTAPPQPLAIGTKPEQIVGKVVQTEKPLTEADLHGKLVLLDFWFIGCKGCMDAMPHLINLRNKYPDSKVEIIGVDVSDKSIEGVRKFINDRGINYTVLLASDTMLAKYSVNFFPTLYVLDKSGAIIHSEIGFNEKEFDEKISKLIDSNL